MALLLPVLAVVLAAPPAERALFVFELAGQPVGSVELSLERERYAYTSRHLFGRTEQARRTEWKLGAEPVPEGWWLWRRPARGCVEGFDEMTKERGTLCAEEVSARFVRGTVLGKPFVARYEADRLVTLEVADARFVRAEAPPDRGVDVFRDGFPVAGSEGPLVLKGRSVEKSRLPEGRAFPSVERAESLAAQVRRLEPGNCLAHARLFVERARASGYAAALVFGVVVEGDRALPHAWVRIEAGRREVELDPTLKIAVTPTTHLALGAEGSAGQAYVDLLAGRASVRRARR